MRELGPDPAPDRVLSPCRSRVVPAVRASHRAPRVRLLIGSWVDHSVGTVEVLGISFGLAAELEELRERQVELIGGLRSVDLRAREPEACIDHVERRRLSLTKREVL